jgi:putative transposase
MPRGPRNAPGGLVYHVLNRAVAKMKMLRHEPDFEAFERVLHEAHERFPIRILSYCIMSNHWHFVVWPRHDGEVTNFFRWLTHTHAMRWRVSHRTVGFGPLYQGRFKSFPVETDHHLLTLCRYVERNPVAAGMTRRAQDWRHGSLWVRLNGNAKQRSILSPWPVDRPRDWTRLVNEPLEKNDVSAIKTSLSRGRPFGDDEWTRKIASSLDLEHTMRREGRPEKAGKIEN